MINKARINRLINDFELLMDQGKHDRVGRRTLKYRLDNLYWKLVRIERDQVLKPGNYLRLIKLKNEIDEVNKWI